MKINKKFVFLSVMARSGAPRQSRHRSLFFLDCFVVPFLAMTVSISTCFADQTLSPSAIKGAQLFQNNCFSCHSVKYLQGTKEIPAFPAKKTPAILGVQPPDLSLEVNLRGVHWVYAYLNGFYPDPTRPLGTNNYIYPDTAMPNMLAGLKSQLSEKEFHAALSDIVDFLAYASEPHKAERKTLGYWVVGFLIIFSLLLWFLFSIISRVKSQEY
jgi:cytochrome c1